MKDYSEQIKSLRNTAKSYKDSPDAERSHLAEQLEKAANSIDELAKLVSELLEAGSAMHTWIFMNSFDEEEAYEECGLTPEQNALFGYGGKLEIHVGEE